MRALVLAVTIAAVAALGGAAARAASDLGAAARASDLVVEGSVAAEPDEFGLTAIVPGRAARRPGALPATLLVRMPRPAATGSSWLLFLVPDAMAGSLGAWAPVDPDAGLVPLDGRAGSRDDLLALADLAVAPPEDPAALVPRLAALAGRGDAPTAFALQELLERPELLARAPADLAPRLRSLLAARSVSPPTAALAVSVLGRLRERGDDVRIIDLVAAGAPDVIVEAAAEALAPLAGAATPGHLEHAIGAAPAASLPGLARLVGAARASSLAPWLCEAALSARRPLRLAALRALSELRLAPCEGSLRELALHSDPETASAAADLLRSLGTGAAP